MARQTDIRLRRSAVSGSVPTTSNLNLGELALNTADGKVYMKKSVGGVDSIVEVGSGAIASSFIAYEYTATSNQTTFSGSDNYSNTLSYNTGTPPVIQVFMNGILLDEGSSADYTATNGTSVVLTTGADAGDLIQIHAYKSDVNVVSNLSFSDNQKVQFGDSNDLQIFHDGSHSRIKDTGTGNLILNTQAFRVNGADDAEGMIKANQDGNVELYYNGSKKLETTNTGVQTTGTLNVNGAFSLPTSDGSNGQVLQTNGSGTVTWTTISSGGSTVWSTSGSDIYYNSGDVGIGTSSPDAKLEVSGGIFKVTNSGNASIFINANAVGSDASILFEEDDNVKAKIQHDASNDSMLFTDGAFADTMTLKGAKVGIGTTSPAGPLHVKSSSNKTLILDATITGSSLTSLAFQRSGADKWRILQQSNDTSLLFYNDISSINQLSLRSNGNIGIGEISPDTTLHLTAASPAITLQESDVSTDFNKTEFQSSGGTLLFNTREEDGTFVSTDYAIGKNSNGATTHTWSVAGSARVQLDSSYFDIEAGGFRVDDPGNNYPFVVSAYGYMTTRSSSIAQLNATDHANVPLSILADVASTRTANYMSVGDIGSAGNRFVIDEVGNVGIGATNPALQSAGTGLHINASAHSEIKFTNSTTGTGASDGTALVATGSGFQINNRESGSILLRTSNATAVTIDSAQNTAFAGNITTSGSISSGNITTTGYLRGPSTFTIDPAAHGDNTGTLVIAGNLQVDGTTTTINSTTLTVDDKNITLASGSTNKAAANAAGITVDCGSDTDARIAYTSATDEWDINKSIHVSGAAGSGVKINSGGAIVGGGATGGDTQLMFWGGGPVYYGRSSLGGTVSGHEFRVGGATKLNVNSSGNTIASGTVSVLGGELFLGTADSSSGHINAFENMSFNIDSDNDDTNRFFEWNVNGNSGSGTELMRLTDDGNLGIGDQDPQDYLEINGSGKGLGGLTISNSTHNHAALSFARSSTATARIYASEPNATHTSQLNFQTSDASGSSPNLVTAMVIADDQKVGIGTDAPSKRLHIKDSAAHQLQLQGSNSYWNVGTGWSGYYQDYLLFATNTGEKMVIDTNGNVGIGNSSPQARLQVEVLGVETNQSSVTSTNQFECEAMSATVFRSARYTVQVTNVTDSTYQITEILLIHDGTTPSITEYGTIYTGSAAEASFDAEIANGNVRLLATPASSDNMQFKVVRHSILV